MDSVAAQAELHLSCSVPCTSACTSERQTASSYWPQERNLTYTIPSVRLLADALDLLISLFDLSSYTVAVSLQLSHFFAIYTSAR